MPTLKTRINITLPAEVEQALVRLAARDEMPTATKAVHLIRLALEIEEDEVWDAIAAKRDTGKARFVSHRRAWK